MKAVKRKSVLNKVNNFLTNETTVHGLPFIVKKNVHLLERIFWIVIITFATIAAVLLCLSNWERFYANPTVVTLQKDFRNWNNAFPAATACYISKWSDKLVEKFIFEKWGINKSYEKFEYYADYAKAVANISYDSLKNFERFENDTSLTKINMLELAVKVIPSIKGTLVTFDAKRQTNWLMILTEMGICFVVNSKFGKHAAIKYQGISDKLPKVDDHILKCHYLNGLCYARYDSDPDIPLKIYIHSYLDIIHSNSDPPLVIKESEEVEINFRMHETYSDPGLRTLRPLQRGCRFDDEPITDDVPVYSTSFCSIACRYRLTIKLCGCKPFFYQKMDGKVCDIKGLMCIEKHTKQILQPPSKLEGCDCPQPCDLITYLPLAPKRAKWQYGYFDKIITFRWGLLPPTTKYHREVLFGLEDLVVAFGGISALFLGVSFISGIEIIVFIMETVIHVLMSRRIQQQAFPTTTKIYTNYQRGIKIPKK